MAKAAGVEEPINFVREHYSAHAVETKPQFAYVEKFDVADVTKKLRRLGWRQRLAHPFS